MFRSLSGFNYRLWFAGALVSNIGTWMQRTAQDWIVLTDLTNNDAVAVGAGWVFIINALTFAATLFALTLLRKDELRAAPRAPRGPGQLKAGIDYVRHRPDIVVILVAIFLVGTFGMNFPIYAATMASEVFHHGAGEFGVLSSLIAIGSLTGALLAARRERPRMRVLFVASAGFGLTTLIAAFMPSYWTFGAALILVGFTAITFMTTANGIVQTTTAPVMRGRVMALYMAIFMGGTPIGAPIIGAVANELGPRWALGVGAMSGFVAAAVGLGWMLVARGMRVRYDSSERMPFRVTFDRPTATREIAIDEIAATSR